jgi:predicted XRE-type DNA-binding protein
MKRAKVYESVWDAIETDPVEAENLKLRSSLMLSLTRHIKREGLTQAEAARLLGVTQPRISNLIHGKIDLFGLDLLVKMAAAA